MIFNKFNIEGLVEIIPTVFEDSRGHFLEFYHKDKFLSAGLDVDFIQDNQSLSHRGVVRGLHFQAPPYAQAKLVRVVSGSVLDVAVDIRKNSPTYGKHLALLVDSKKKNMFFIPEGFAHGFLTLEDNTVFQYKCSNIYNKESEGSIIWNDEILDIDWQIENPIVSEKDAVAQTFKNFVSPF